jgi:transcriptional regulator with XRE-family HTH domain
MSQEQLAAAMGKKSKNTVSGWENDGHDVRISDLKKLCSVLEVDVDVLLGFKTEGKHISEIADMSADIVTRSPAIKILESELSGMSEAEVKRMIRMARAAKDEE